MCIAFLLTNAHPQLALLLTFNRDEFLGRPTTPAHFWPDKPNILAGRDNQRHGTWLGVTVNGRFALLTNFREPTVYQTHNGLSRGALTTDFLDGNQTPMEFLESIQGGAYAGFNLIVGDLRSGQVAYYSNKRATGPEQLPPGVHGLSNGFLEQWPKVQRGMARFKQLVGQAQQQQEEEQQPISCTKQQEPTPQPSPSNTHSAACSQHHCHHHSLHSAAIQPPYTPTSNTRSPAIPWDTILHDIMADTQRISDPSQLPQTGCSADIEQLLSPTFIQECMLWGEPYGTRSQTVLAVWRDGHAELRERFRADGGEWDMVVHEFDMLL